MQVLSDEQVDEQESGNQIDERNRGDGKEVELDEHRPERKREMARDEAEDVEQSEEI